MSKRIFIIHGWGGHPNEGWLLWLRKQLEDKGYELNVPAMPETDFPKIREWVSFLSAQVGQINEDTFFVGHSIGCQTILRYFQSLEEGRKSGGVVLVAPWLDKEGSLHLYDEEETQIAKPWIEESIDLEKVKMVNKEFVCIFSDNDEVVPLTSNKNRFENDLGAKIIIEHGKGHFTQEDSVFELLSALNEILGIINKDGSTSN